MAWWAEQLDTHRRSANGRVLEGKLPNVDVLGCQGVTVAHLEPLRGYPPSEELVRPRG